MVRRSCCQLRGCALFLARWDPRLSHTPCRSSPYFIAQHTAAPQSIIPTTVSVVSHKIVHAFYPRRPPFTCVFRQTAGDALGEITRLLARWASQSILPAKGPSTLDRNPWPCLAEPPALPCVTIAHSTHTANYSILHCPRARRRHTSSSFTYQTSASHLPARQLIRSKL